MNKLVVGLGNPGSEYARNRHNAGFLILDEFAQTRRLSWSVNKKLEGEIAMDKELSLILFKPSTFMNKSGQAVVKALDYFQQDVSHMVVVHDDVDLPNMEFKVSNNSSSAGHHGVQDIIDRTGTQDFTRVRVGVGRPEHNSRNVEKYVLSDFTPDELETVKKQGVEHLLSSLNL